MAEERKAQDIPTAQLNPIEPEDHDEEKEQSSDRVHLSAGNSSMQLDDRALTNEAELIMKKMLPSHIVNCFLVTGYDTLEVIAEINDESLAEIEEIVNSDFPNESCFRHQAIPTSAQAGVFKFSPGHRKRIVKFVQEVKQVLNTRQKEHESVASAGIKRRRVAISAGAKYANVSDDTSAILDSNDSVDNVSSELDLLTDFRQIFAKWQRNPKHSQYREIRENKDFFVNISISTPDNTIKASVRCSTCGHVESLGTKSGKVLLSNWYRHIQIYCKKKFTGSKSLDNFFTISATKNTTDSASQKTVAATDYISPTRTDKCKHVII